MKMTKFQRFVLRYIFTRLFIQGPEHHRNAAEVYNVVRQVWEEEFTEDNVCTVDAMLREAFEATQYSPKINPTEITELRKAYWP